jgi:hypothetical protein
MRFWGAGEIRAAKIILHVSGWQPRHRLVAAARCGWSRCGHCRNFISLRSVQSFLGEMVSGVGVDYGRCSPGDRISHPLCGGPGGAMLSGNRLFMAPCAILGLARRQAAVFWDNRYGCCDCVTRAGCVFPRWSFVRTPRNRDSALIAPTGIVTACDSRANS